MTITIELSDMTKKLHILHEIKVWMKMMKLEI